MSVAGKKLTQNSILTFFLVVMMVVSSNDIISFFYGMTLKPGFVLIVLFSFFSIGMMSFSKSINWVDARDIPIIMWVFLCIVFCFCYGKSRNYVYTFSAIVYVGMALSAKSDFFLYKKNIVLSAFVNSGVFIALIGIVQFCLGVAGLGEYAFVRQWWYEGVIARVNGLSYEPSYYGLVVTPYLVFSFLAVDTSISHKVGNKSINILFLLSTIALVISSSRVSIVFAFIFLALLVLYKAKVFGKRVFLIAVTRFLFVVFLSVVYFLSVSLATDLLSDRANSPEDVENTPAQVTNNKTPNESLSSSILEQTRNDSSDKNSDNAVLKGSNKYNIKLNKAVTADYNTELDKELPLDYLRRVEIKKDDSTVSEDDKKISPNHQSVFSGTGLEGEPSHSVVTRWNDFNNTISVAKKHIIYGVGLGGIAYEIAREKGIYNISSNNVRQYEGLVPFVEVSAATGVLGLFLFLLWIVIVTMPYIVYPVLRKDCSSEKLIVSFYCLAVLAQLLLMQSNQNILRMYFWVNVFIMMVFVYSSKNQTE